MFNQHITRAVSRTSKPPIVRAYDGSVLRPDLSNATTYHEYESLTQLTLNTQKMNETTQNQLNAMRDQMYMGFKTLNESLLVFSEKVASQFSLVTARLEKLESRVPQSSPPIALPAQALANYGVQPGQNQAQQLPPQGQGYNYNMQQNQPQALPYAHPQNTSQNTSFYANASPAAGPSQFQLQQFHQLLGAQIAKHVRDFKPQALYDHFFGLGQTVVDYLNDVQTLSRTFGVDLTQFEISEAYALLYDRIASDVFSFAASIISSTTCIISESLNVVMLENVFKQVFRQAPKLGQAYSFSLVYTAFAIVLVLKFQDNLLRFSDISGTLAEFHTRYGIECAKEQDRRCQVVLPQWIGKAQIAAYVKLLR